MLNVTLRVSTDRCQAEIPLKGIAEKHPKVGENFFIILQNQKVKIDLGVIVNLQVYGDLYLAQN